VKEIAGIIRYKTKTRGRKAESEFTRVGSAVVFFAIYVNAVDYGNSRNLSSLRLTSEGG